MDKQKELENRIAVLEDIIKSFMNNATMPYEFGVAIKARLNVKSMDVAQGLAVSSKAVNELGSGSYNVAKVYDGMLITEDGKLIGYYNP